MPEKIFHLVLISLFALFVYGYFRIVDWENNRKVKMIFRIEVIAFFIALYALRLLTLSSDIDPYLGIPFIHPALYIFAGCVLVHIVKSFSISRDRYDNVFLLINATIFILSVILGIVVSL